MVLFRLGAPSRDHPVQGPDPRKDSARQRTALSEPTGRHRWQPTVRVIVLQSNDLTRQSFDGRHIKLGNDFGGTIAAAEFVGDNCAGTQPAERFPHDVPLIGR